MYSNKKTASGTMRSMLRSTALLLAALCMLLTTAPSADARSRGVSIGLGVGAGLIILKSLSEGKSRERASRSSRSKKYGSKSSRKVHTAKKSKSKSRRDKDEEDDGSIPAEAAAEPAAATPAEGVKQQAAPVVAAPPTVTGAIPPTAAGASERISTTAEVTAAQEHLRYLGFDVPQVSGTVDLPTKIAVMKFQESISAPTTGELTVEQLKRLFVLASERQSKAP